ncbi:MAG: hypothetical protein BMS9Abin29_0863 [Gemmatimonadota bacterium]|nr:MAG: hypothetical protein BMS9Abin29_0863 [Gemmatimonadota bacterium]
MEFKAKSLVMLALAPAAAGTLTFAGPTSVEAQVSEADSLELLAKAKDVQTRFERYREERIPPELGRGGRGCDDLVGRFCLRFGGEDESGEWQVPEEPIEFGMARVRVLRDLAEIARKIPGDEWVLGQRVYYMGEVGDWGRAEKLAQQCGGRESWWCTALIGMIRNAEGQWIEADEIFDQAIAQMPPDVAADWQAPTYLLDDDGVDAFKDAPDKQTLEDRMWLLADPLYLVDGNDRKTEQYARQVLIRIREEAANAYGVEWGDDIEQLTLRYGAEKAWERRRSVPTASLQDTRSIVGRHNPKGQEFMPPGPALVSPSDVPADAWKLEQKKPHTGYAPPYAPDLNALETQVARFRRGDSLLVVGAFAPEVPGVPEERRRTRMTGNPGLIDMRARRNVSREDRQRRSNPFGSDEVAEPFMPAEPEKPQVAARVVSGLFLIDENTAERSEVRGEGPEGAFQLLVPNGRYIVGVEAFSPDEKKAWRDRRGLWQDELPFGLASVSDLLILKGGGPNPETLAEAIPSAMAAIRIPAGERFKVAWELYGLAIGESAQVRIGIDDGGLSLLQRAGRFFRVLEPDSPVVMSWEEAGPDVLGTVFRSVELNLPDVEPGDYTLTVEIQLAGREAMTVGRKITIVP